MIWRCGTFVKAILTAFVRGGCTTTISERFAPELDEAKYVIDLGVCHGADVVRFTATSIGNVIGYSVGGFINLAAKGGPAASSVEGLLILGVAEGVPETGVGVVKTIEDWESGIQDCLLGMGYTAPHEERTSEYILS